MGKLPPPKGGQDYIMCIINNCPTMSVGSPKFTRFDLRAPKFQKFPGGACPQTPLEGNSLRSLILLPPNVFLDETLMDYVVKVRNYVSVS